jgi:hypothetical protein
MLDSCLVGRPDSIPPEKGTNAPYPIDQHAVILLELKTILGSVAFRGSKRCGQFLTYVVENTLAGREEALKERSIGVAVFGRSPSYGTGEDPIVRVTAKEVRQRLKQHFAECSGGRIRIDLPAGSYLAEFTPVAGGWRRAIAFTPGVLRRFAIAVGISVILAGAGLAVRKLTSKNPLDLFWAPVILDNAPILISVANPNAYQFDDEFYDRVQFYERQRDTTQFTPGDLIHGNEVFPVSVVGTGDARATALLTSFFGLRGKRAQVRIANDTTFTDLRNSATVMIGFNRWAREMTGSLRFVFTYYKEGHRRIWSIQDNQAAGKFYSVRNSADARDTSPKTDYGVISRLLHSNAGRPFVVVAGVGDAGTQAAAECLTSLECLGAAFRNAPSGWENKNLQVLISTRAMAGVAGTPEILATHYW